MKHLSTRKYTLRKEGQLRWVMYYLNGRLHRKGGPAFVYYRPDGVLQRAYYYRWSRLHRDDGPATVTRLLSGAIVHEFYLNGEKVEKL
mgnify:CR=1 FL=1